MTKVNQHGVEDVKVSTGINSVDIEVEHARGKRLQVVLLSDQEPTESGRAEMLESIIDSTEEALEKVKAEEK